MNSYERYLYWTGFAHGKAFTNSCHMTESQLKQAERNLMDKGISPLSMASKDDLFSAIRGIG